MVDFITDTCQLALRYSEVTGGQLGLGGTSFLHTEKGRLIPKTMNVNFFFSFLLGVTQRPREQKKKKTFIKAVSCGPEATIKCLIFETAR